MKIKSLMPICFMAITVMFSVGFICPFSSGDDLRQETVLTADWQVTSPSGKTEAVTIPHCWNAVDGADGGPCKGNHSVDGTSYWRGAKTYSRMLDIKPKADKRYFLRFEGAGITTKVSVNGKTAGTHKGAFGAFCYEITKLLNPSDNRVEVIVDNSFNVDITPLSGDFTMFGGLYRPVTLIETNKSCINPANVGASSGIQLLQERLTNDIGELRITAEISGSVTEAHATIEDASGRQFGWSRLTIRDSQATGTLSAHNPIRWHGVKNPYLYKVTVSVYAGDKKCDEVTQKWGFRKVEISADRGFVLNGEPMKLHGVNAHQDEENKGWARQPEDFEKDIKLMKEMGVNAFRAAHYPHSTRMYDLCDEAGFVVWAELPVVEKTIDNDPFFNECSFQLEEMIRQHQNHPSIVMWSIGNELGAGANGRRSSGGKKLVDILYKECKTLDPTRACAIAINGMTTTVPDVLGFNIYPGWYWGKADDMKKDIENLCKRYAGKPICISEYGAGGSVNQHKLPPERPKTTSAFHPEEWQCVCHERNYYGIKNATEQCLGSFVWNMFDFGADHRQEGEHKGQNDKGLVSYDRNTKKDVYYFYQANWTQKPMIHLTSRRFTERPSMVMPFKIYSNCDEVTLFLNGDSIGMRKPNDINVFEWDGVSLSPGTYTIVAKGKKGNKTLTDQYTFTVINQK